MKRKIMALLLGTMICVGAVACGSKADNTTEAVTEDTPVEEGDVAAAAEETISEDEVVADAAAETVESTEATETVEAGSEDAGTSDNAEEENKYSVFTDASNEEVEAFAQKVVDAVASKDWDTVGDMIEYPIGSEETNNLCNNKEEFLAYVDSTGFSDEDIESLAAWNLSDLWANWQGACIADGTIWFRDVDPENKVFKIVSLFDMREAGGEITD